jgi:hypothetical protein
VGIAISILTSSQFHRGSSDRIFAICLLGPGFLSDSARPFGAVFGQFALRGMKYAPIALILALVPLLLKWKAYVVIPIAVFGTIIIGRFIYSATKKNA